ncbi:hypothetical protein [Spartinivicinus ruber]|uniref:hypothetical protein n=1 Tax=Spartinivicinus ruber TaxID=2683272 RepID=UPI0013D1A817|nr:hypothetical protein [Spartinivicinus ruber]
MKGINERQKLNFTTILVIIFFSHFIIAATIIAINNNLIKNKNNQKKETTNDFSYVKIAILDRINNIKKDIRLIANIIHNTTDSSNVAKDKTIIELFESMIETRGFYDQVRILNTKGKEILRLNKNENSAVKVTDDKLQDKSNRYYFTDIYSSPPDKFYISKLDWNIEADAVELPLKATIRIGIPIKLDLTTNTKVSPKHLSH